MDDASNQEAALITKEEAIPVDEENAISLKVTPVHEYGLF